MVYLPIMHSIYQAHQLLIRVVRYMIKHHNITLKDIFQEQQRKTKNFSKFWTVAELGKNNQSSTKSEWLCNRANLISIGFDSLETNRISYKLILYKS